MRKRKQKQALTSSLRFQNWHFRVPHNAICFPHKTLHNFLLSISQGMIVSRREIKKQKAYGKFCGVNKLYYGERENRKSFLNVVITAVILRL